MDVYQMASKYAKKNIVSFKINDIEYSLYEHVIKKMALFDNIREHFDAGVINPQNAMASEDLIELIFDILSSSVQNECGKILGLPLEQFLQMVNVMRFLLVDEQYITQCYVLLIGNNTLVQLATQCINIPFFYEMFYLIDQLGKTECKMHPVKMDRLLHDIVENVSFPKALKYSWIRLLLTFDLTRVRDCNLDIDHRYWTKAPYYRSPYNIFDKFCKLYGLNYDTESIEFKTTNENDVEVIISDKIYLVGKEKILASYVSKTDCDSHGNYHDKTDLLVDYMRWNKFSYETVNVIVNLDNVLVEYLTDVCMKMIVD